MEAAATPAVTDLVSVQALLVYIRGAVCLGNTTNIYYCFMTLTSTTVSVVIIVEFTVKFMYLFTLPACTYLISRCFFILLYCTESDACYSIFTYYSYLLASFSC